ncbi:MAG: hypothetical protein LBI39_02050 [Puniceicoccales bacterium]|jgi:hypothetical protein|nr:hypothetical protein [Puniceicoccales bacterium]
MADSVRGLAASERVLLGRLEEIVTSKDLEAAKSGGSIADDGRLGLSGRCNCGTTDCAARYKPKFVDAYRCLRFGDVGGFSAAFQALALVFFKKEDLYKLLFSTFEKMKAIEIRSDAHAAIELSGRLRGEELKPSQTVAVGDEVVRFIGSLGLPLTENDTEQLKVWTSRLNCAAGGDIAIRIGQAHIRIGNMAKPIYCFRGISRNCKIALLAIARLMPFGLTTLRQSADGGTQILFEPNPSGGDLGRLGRSETWEELVDWAVIGGNTPCDVDGARCKLDGGRVVIRAQSGDCILIGEPFP